ncbi:MAG: flavodoxin family protein [Desulfobulbaceae bacterium]|mgnify:CR=1 FL=1|nr:MAG: flavodoxin family protein [Desulfobulbaceae bacterium]
MSEILIAFFSSTGNNRYIANRFAKELQCDIEEIKPRFDFHVYLFVASRYPWLYLGNNPLMHLPAGYRKVVLCGPIWMGSYLAPLRSFVINYGGDINQLYFVTCCGSSEENSKSKYGYESVFSELKNTSTNRSIQCYPLSMSLVVPDAQKDDNETIMKARLSDENFSGEMLNRFNEIKKRIASD